MQNHKPKTLNPEPSTLNPEPETPNVARLKFRQSSLLEASVDSLSLGRRLLPGYWERMDSGLRGGGFDLRFRIQGLGFRV